MIRTDLTGYAALLGESLTSRVGLLEKLLGDSHYPSLGQYKERLLAETIRGFLPRTIEVGTGFVMFPHVDPHPPGGEDMHDPLNQSAYSMSKQCDILVYDVSSFPPVFRDGDFVIVRPEAVRAVIEVKGSLSVRELQGVLESFYDFGEKWRDTQLFYIDHNQPTTPLPGLFAMAWKMQSRTNGQPTTSPTRLREKISSFYGSRLKASECDGFPLLRSLLVHSECEIEGIGGFPEAGSLQMSAGWHSTDGRFTRVAQDGSLVRDKDRTIASLLASLHWQVAKEHFNRFFSYTDEIKSQWSVPYKHSGYSWTWTDLPKKPFNDDLPVKRDK